MFELTKNVPMWAGTCSTARIQVKIMVNLPMIMIELLIMKVFLRATFTSLHFSSL